MRINATHLVLICLTLTWGVSPVTACADPTTVKETNPIANNLAQNNIIKASQTTSKEKDTPTRKEIIVDESRGLSAFFILGIAINIIMAVTFGWWFSKEWRRSKNN